MTRIAFITDTHLGSDATGYQQQKAYPARLREILAALRHGLQEDGGVDFVLHGGDMIHESREDLRREAREVFDVGVPLYLCLGNHDLTEPDAVALWERHAPGFFAGDPRHFELETGDAVVHVVPNHWGDQTHCWAESQVARFGESPLARIESVVAAQPGKVHILCTHSPVFGVGPGQTGLDDPIHVPAPAFRDAVTGLLDRCPQLRCVLGGHNHLNSLALHGGAAVVTGAAFCETPFDYKVIEVGGAAVSIRTRSLFHEVGFEAEYDFDRCHVQGRSVDRNRVAPR